MAAATPAARSRRVGSAVSTMPSGPIKCAGAPQKIAYLAADYWRKQAPVVVENLLAVCAGNTPEARYSRYASCPLTTARNKMLLAEFDYTMQPAPSIPIIDTTRERRDMWLFKRYGLPFLYWNFILKGKA